MKKGVIPIFIGIRAGEIYSGLLNPGDALNPLKAPVRFHAPAACYEVFAM